MNDGDMMGALKAILIMSLFFSFAITGISYAIPEDAKQYVSIFMDTGTSLDLDTTSQTLKESMERQINIPVIDLGALVFYSGNIIMDLLINFIFAIPQMLGLLLAGLFMFIQINPEMAQLIQVFIAVITFNLYIIGLIQLMTNVRSGRLI